jgi:hypothetical protein
MEAATEGYWRPAAGELNLIAGKCNEAVAILAVQHPPPKE